MRILGYISVVLFVTTSAMGQQINPVPDYIFRNQMSVGRNAPTDTAAYMSIGPRYGAVKGFMPPMVVDTNAVTGTKRNGLLIFSVQLNNFAYWDSTTSRFRQITAQATVDSLVFATRAWRKKGDDSLGAVIATRTDTALLSTKAYRQKAVDSLVTLISTLGGGTVLSVGSGYGTNFSTITTSGSVVVDSLVITSRASRDKLKDSLNANIALKVNISDTSTMLGAYLRKADTTSMLSPYLRKGDTTAMLSPYVRAAGFGLTKGTQTLSVDSALIATRARVQKGIDSVASLVAAPDSLLFSTRAWRQKGDDSLGAIIGTKATATGTTNYLSKFTGTSSLGNSIVYATTSEVGISTPSPTEALDVNGKVRIRTIDSSASPSNMLWTDATGVIRKTSVPTLAVDSVLFSTRAWRQKGDDSLAAIIATKGTGTVTSVAAGTGMSFSTITTTGSVSADTVALATRAWRQKGIDSVQANVALKVNISDTATMLSPYVRIAGFGLTKGTQTLSVDSVLIATRARVQKGIDSVASLISSTDSLVFSTRAWRQKGIDSLASVRIGGSGTINRVPKFTASGTIGDGSIADSSSSVIQRILSNGRVTLGTTTDAGDYRLQVSGGFYNTANAVLALSSGGVSIGTTTQVGKLNVVGSGAMTTFNTGAATDARIEFLYNGSRRSLFNIDDDAVGFQQNSGKHFYMTGTNSNVGVGLTNPQTRFAVNIPFTNVNDIGYLVAGQTGTSTRVAIVSIAQNTTTGASALGFYTFSGSALEKARIDSNGRLGIGTATPSELLDVNGKARVRTIDSTATAINMLYADANGVIMKTAVPASSVAMSTDEMTAASGWTIAYDKTQAYPVNDVNKTVDGSIATVTINTAAYRTTATFNTDQWVHVATVPAGFRPESDVYFSLPNTVAGASFRSTSSVGFTSYNFYQEEAAVRVLPNGNVEVYVGLVSNSADLSGANYVIMPIAVTYNIETYPN